MKRIFIEYRSLVRGPFLGASFFTRVALELIRIEKGARLKAFSRSSARVSLVMVSEAHSKRLNAAFRRQKKPATTLAFPFAHDTRIRLPFLYLGEIIMAPTLVSRRARERGESAKRELTRHFTHAMLHLLGYNHEGRGKKFRRDERLMKYFEEKIVSHFNL